MQLHFGILNSNFKALLRTANSLLNNIKKIPVNEPLAKFYHSYSPTTASQNNESPSSHPLHFTPPPQ